MNTQQIPIPPELIVGRTGGGDYVTGGKNLFNVVLEFSGLKPHERILEVGSGSGKLASYLARYLDSDGSYEGLDIVSEFVEWCTDNISRFNPNVRFQYIDVYNKGYAPNGKTPPANYRFPFQDKSFDVVVLFSVFTHMLPVDMENYLSEISRVLKDDGRLVASFFLINAGSIGHLKLDQCQLKFVHEGNGYFTTDLAIPEAAIAFKEEYVTELHAKYRLDIREKVYGYWSGRKVFFAYQDLIASSKH